MEALCPEEIRLFRGGGVEGEGIDMEYLITGREQPLMDKLQILTAAAKDEVGLRIMPELKKSPSI